jgi:hypothetical protein
MKTTRILMMALMTCTMTVRAYADEWPSISRTEFFSENGAYRLKIKPHPQKPGHCLATLFRGDEEVWSRHLINDHAPVRVFVAESGRYVITMDEWHHVGELPVVIYGSRGDLIRVHSTDSLGLKEDAPQIARSISSYWWNQHSLSFFGPDDEVFFIRLNWGKWVVIDLAPRSGEVLAREPKPHLGDDLRERHAERWKRLDAYREENLPRHVIRLLRSEDAGERKTGVMICGRENLTEIVPVLRELLNDKEEFIRDAAKATLKEMGQPVEDVPVEEPEP